MRHLAMTGMDTAAMMARIIFGEAMRATPPACSAMVACSAVVTSMMTPPLSISARPVLRRRLVVLPLFVFPLVWDIVRNLFANAKDGRRWRLELSILQRGVPFLSDSAGYLLKIKRRITAIAMKLQRAIATKRSMRLTFGERLGVFLELR